MEEIAECKKRCPTCGSLRVFEEDGYTSVFRCSECKELFSGNESNERSEDW